VRRRSRGRLLAAAKLKTLHTVKYAANQRLELRTARRPVISRLAWVSAGLNLLVWPGSRFICGASRILLTRRAL